MKKEYIEFMKQLKKDLIEQDNDSKLNDYQASPRFWGIMEDNIIIYTNEEGYHGEPCIVLDDTTYSQKEIDALKEYLYENFSEDIERYYIENITNIEDLYEELSSNQWIGNLFSLVYKDIETTISQHTGAFLTKKDCQEYIEKFGYNHSNPRTYAMTAFRNFRYEKLLEIIINTDWDKL